MLMTYADVCYIVLLDGAFVGRQWTLFCEANLGTRNPWVCTVHALLSIL